MEKRQILVFNVSWLGHRRTPVSASMRPTPFFPFAASKDLRAVARQNGIVGGTEELGGAKVGYPPSHRHQGGPVAGVCRGDVRTTVSTKSNDSG